MSAVILVVEDEPAVRELVTFHLERGGFTVRAAEDAEQAWPLLADSDLLVLDRMLPGASGEELLRRLRRADGSRLPVLMLTARGTELDRVEGLEAGADDYLVKPFSAAELVARVRALLRRTAPVRSHTVGELTVDESSGTARLAGNPVPLTRREFELLAFLIASRGRIYSRRELLDRVWGEEFLGTERTVDQHVAQLRSRLGNELIETVRGRGYRLAGGE
ncbi:MAG: response regulator transcription factor [Trueperaceae bacterium]